MEEEIQPELDAARAIAYMFYGMLKRARHPWMLASKHTPFLWGSLFAVQRGRVELRARGAAGGSIDGGRHHDAAASGRTAQALIAT